MIGENSKMKNSDLIVNMLIDLAEYDTCHAWEIYRKEIKPEKSIRARMIKCYQIIEKRREQF